MMGNIYRFSEFYAVHGIQQRKITQYIWYHSKTSKSRKTNRIGIKGNEEANKAAKQTIGMPGLTQTKLPYIDHQKHKKL